MSEEDENQDKTEQYEIEDALDMSLEEYKQTFPSGWLKVSKPLTRITLEIFLESPDKEFTIDLVKQRLSERNREEIKETLANLEDKDILLGNGEIYTLNEDSEITKNIQKINQEIKEI